MESAPATATSPKFQPRRQEEFEQKQQHDPVTQGSTTTTYATDYVRDAAAWLWATVRRDFSGPQTLMRAFFDNVDYSPAQKLDHLVSQWRSLGLNGDGLKTFVEQLVFATEGAVLKDEFRPIFAEFKAFKDLPEFVQALTQPNTTEGKRVLTSLKEALRTDPAYLAGITKEAMASRLPIQEKAVHLMLFLNTRGVSDEQARECYAKIPAEQQAFFGEEAVDLETVTVAGMQGVVEIKIDPLAVLNVMQSFQAQGFGVTVTQLHQTMLDKTFHRPLLNLQVAVKEEKEGKKVQTERPEDLVASVAPGTSVEYRLFSILGVEFNHFTGCEASKPCGDVATDALKRMIAEVQKQRAEADK